jgi:hypothetical protein
MIFKSEHTRQALSIRFVQAFIYFCVCISFLLYSFVFKTFFSLNVQMMSRFPFILDFLSQVVAGLVRLI